jgi:hypothetical protein
VKVLPQGLVIARNSINVLMSADNLSHYERSTQSKSVSTYMDQMSFDSLTFGCDQVFRKRVIDVSSSGNQPK